MHKQSNARGVVMFLQDHNIRYYNYRNKFFFVCLTIFCNFCNFNLLIHFFECIFRKLLRLVKSLNMTGHFLWVASDSWGTKKESIDSNDEVAEGAITFSPKSYQIKGSNQSFYMNIVSKSFGFLNKSLTNRCEEFNEYFEKLKPHENKRNPWFLEFWEEQFNCTMDENVSYSTNYRRSSSRSLCSGHERLNITQDSFIHFVIDSVFAMAHAIENLIKTKCNETITNQATFTKCQRAVEMRGVDLLKEIRQVEFNSITGRRVRFGESGDGLAPYEVFQYQLLDPEHRKYGYLPLFFCLLPHNFKKFRFY